MIKRKIYNWHYDDWPQFEYDLTVVQEKLYEYATLTGKIYGVQEAITKDQKILSQVDLMILEALKTSEIEGEYLSRKDVKSSIRNNLGLNKPKEPIRDMNAKGAGELMLLVREEFKKPLSNKMLFGWHKKLFPIAKGLRVGAYRNHPEPMQVISGAMGKEKIHYEAPPSDRVKADMKRFIEWFNYSAKDQTLRKHMAPIRAAIAHLHFESIHPFEDGNGRVGRAISEKALSQGLDAPVMLSLSKSIVSKKKDYYEALKLGQRSLEITPWLVYFIDMILHAQEEALSTIQFTIKKTKFFDAHKKALNARQLKVVKRVMRDGEDEFEGGLNVRKYIAITRTSKPTATRDLQDLVTKNLIKPVGKGRSTRYEINFNTV